MYSIVHWSQMNTPQKMSIWPHCLTSFTQLILLTQHCNTGHQPLHLPSFLYITGGLSIKGQGRMTLTDQIKVWLSEKASALGVLLHKTKTNGTRCIIDHFGVLIPFMQMSDTHRQHLTVSSKSKNLSSSFTSNLSQQKFSIFPYDVFQCSTRQRRSRGVNTWQRALFRIQRSSLTCCIYCKWGKTAECKMSFKKKKGSTKHSQQTGSPACELLFFWHIFQLGCVTHYTHALTLSFISSNTEQNIKNLAGDSAKIF